MNRRTFVKTLPALTVLASTTAGLAQDTPKTTQDLKPVTLPKPDMSDRRPGGSKVLLLHRHGSYRGQRLFVRRFARVGGVVPQLQQGGSSEGFQIAKRTARAFCADSWISCLAAVAHASTHPDI
jgi:hypothetical protein